jgi:hypothetical protein
VRVPGAPHVGGSDESVVFSPGASARVLERGLYVWITSDAGQDPLNTTEERAALLTFIDEHNVDTVFLDMYHYLGASNGSPEKTGIIQDVIAAIHAQGASKKVFALAGNTDWSIPSTHGWIEANITDKIAEYNTASTANERFDGVHLDVEYWTDGEQMTIDAVAGLGTLVDDMRTALSLPVGLFSAFYLTDATATRPSIEYNAKTQQDGKHLMDMADHLVIGSYRNTADVNLVDDVVGVIGLVQPWYDYAIANARSIYAGVETIDIEPAYLSFFGMTKAAMEGEIALVHEAFPAPEYRGLSVHNYDGWKALS